MHATDARQRNIPRAGAAFRLDRDEQRGAFEFFANCVRRLRPVQTPPIFGSANLRLGKIADVDVERVGHSLLRSSARNSFIGVI